MSRVFVVMFAILVSAAVTTDGYGQGRAKAAVSPCVLKGGEATGITRTFAEYEALLIIRQVTGNWPIETDRIDRVRYTCRQDAAGGWTCRANARVCPPGS